MQGLSYFVPTQIKIQYINLLIKAGFHTLDFGSFVSPKAIPQMADTYNVLEGLDLKGSNTKLLAVVANQRGVEQACGYAAISYLGFPLSVSETFQQRNTNSGITEGLNLIKHALELCYLNEKELVVYLSMAFGNPYGDDYSVQMVSDYAGKIAGLGCTIISLADTVGLATTSQIQHLGETIFTQFPEIEIGMHLHVNPDQAKDKIVAAINSGCKRIDTAIGGFGGCPFAEDNLTGNMPTEILLDYFGNNNISHNINLEMFAEARRYLLQHVIQ